MSRIPKKGQIVTEHEVKKMINSKKIGEIEYVEIKESRAGSEAIPWFLDLKAGGGTLISNASYPLSLLQYLFGIGFDEVIGLHKAPETLQADYECQLVLKKEQLLITLFISSLMKFQSRLEIHGTLGKIVIFDYWKTQKASILFNTGEKKEIYHPHQSEFSYEIAHVDKCLSDGFIESPLVPWEMTLHTVETVEKLYKTWYGDNWPNSIKNIK